MKIVLELVNDTTKKNDAGWYYRVDMGTLHGPFKQMWEALADASRAAKDGVLK